MPTDFLPLWVWAPGALFGGSFLFVLYQAWRAPHRQHWRSSTDQAYEDRLTSDERSYGTSAREPS